MSSSSAILNVTQATRSYGTRRALDGVDLTLRREEIYALLGPNGAGKTSLVRAISGRLRLDAGRVEVAGADPRTNPKARLELGLVPQEIALYPHLTARENLEVLGRLTGVSGSNLNRSVDRALDWAGLAPRADDRVEHLSGGMQRRLNMAAGALHAPGLLLLDEPTVGVDPAAREQLHDLVRSLREDGHGILLTTHDMEQAEELADRIGIMVDGRICVEDTLEGLVRRSFGEDQVLSLSVTDTVTEPGRDLLETKGLRRSSSSRAWSGRWTKGVAALPGLETELRRAGIEIVELTVREPGLRAVYFDVTGREFDA